MCKTAKQSNKGCKCVDGCRGLNDDGEGWEERDNTKAMGGSIDNVYLV